MQEEAAAPCERRVGPERRRARWTRALKLRGHAWMCLMGARVREQVATGVKEETLSESSASLGLGNDAHRVRGHRGATYPLIFFGCPSRVTVLDPHDCIRSNVVSWFRVRSVS